MAHSKARVIKELKAKNKTINQRFNHLKKLVKRFDTGRIRPIDFRFIRITKKLYLAFLK